MTIQPTKENGLDKISVADTLQLRSIDIKRFINKFGVLSSLEMQKLVTAIALIIEYQDNN